MNLPIRKEAHEPEQELTTADLAQGKRPAKAETQAGPFLAERVERPAGENTTGGTAQGGVAANATGSTGSTTDHMPLFPRNELEEMRNRWGSIQTAFVDEPRRAVEQADGLVASGMKRLAEVFAEERARLEGQWDRGDNVSTEELRLALQRYRSFFHRLLSV